MLLFWFFELYSIGKDIKNGLDYQRLSGEEHDSLPCLRLFLLYDVANISNKTDIIGLFCIFVFILPVLTMQDYIQLYKPNALMRYCNNHHMRLFAIHHTIALLTSAIVIN